MKAGDMKLDTTLWFFNMKIEIAMIILNLNFLKI